MGETTAISWCDHSFNPWLGCTKVSPACDGCYAENLMDTRYKRVKWGGPGKGVGTRVRTSASNWKEPPRWHRKAIAAGTRPFVFCASLADVFDNQVEEAWRIDLFNLIASTPQLVWLLLTKRPQNIADMADDAGGLPANAAIGTTAEDQQRWDINIPALLAAKAETQAPFAFASCEPLLGAINPRRAPVVGALRKARRFAWSADTHLDPIHPRQDPRFKLDWIITGGETDQGKHRARPAHPQWFRDIRDACEATGTAYHHKQNGEWVSVSEVEGEGQLLTFHDGSATVRRIGASRSGRTIDSVVHDARPAVRELEKA